MFSFNSTWGFISAMGVGLQGVALLEPDLSMQTVAHLGGQVLLGTDHREWQWNWEKMWEDERRWSWLDFWCVVMIDVCWNCSRQVPWASFMVLGVIWALLRSSIFRVCQLRSSCAQPCEVVKLCADGAWPIWFGAPRLVYCEDSPGYQEASWPQVEQTSEFKRGCAWASFPPFPRTYINVLFPNLIRIKSRRVATIRTVLNSTKDSHVWFFCICLFSNIQNAICILWVDILCWESPETRPWMPWKLQRNPSFSACRLLGCEHWLWPFPFPTFSNNPVASTSHPRANQQYWTVCALDLRWFSFSSCYVTRLPSADSVQFGHRGNTNQFNGSHDQKSTSRKISWSQHTTGASKLQGTP